MSFTRAKLTNWLRGDKITPTQINKIADDLAAAVDCATLSLGATKTITRIAKNPVFSDSSGTLQWHSSGFVYATLATAGPPYAYYILSLPHGATWTSATVYLQGAGAHGGLPGLPQLSAYEFDPVNATQTQLGLVTDPSASVPAYEAAHTITLSGLSTVVDNVNHAYIVKVDAESVNGNQLNGMQLFGCSVTYTMTALDFGSA